MSDEPREEEVDEQSVRAELLPNREAMSVINPLTTGQPPPELAFPAEPDLGDPEPSV
jgi:hypothetical protein